MARERNLGYGARGTGSDGGGLMFEDDCMATIPKIGEQCYEYIDGTCFHRCVSTYDELEIQCTNDVDG